MVEILYKCKLATWFSSCEKLKRQYFLPLVSNQAMSADGSVPNDKRCSSLFILCNPEGNRICCCIGLCWSCWMRWGLCECEFCSHWSSLLLLLKWHVFLYRKRSRSLSSRRHKSRSLTPRRHRSRSPTSRRHRRQRSKSTSLSPIGKSLISSTGSRERKDDSEMLRKQEEEKKRYIYSFKIF